MDYEERLNRVTNYIHDHLDEAIDLKTLAEVACLSPYHWHRIYHAVRGETIAATIKRVRLHRAAGYLAHTTVPVRVVAERAGFKDLHAFTRLFKSVFGMPPAHFRRTQEERTVATYQVKIEDIAERSLVGVEHRGDYMKISRAFDTLFTWLGTRQLIRPGMRMVALYCDDPSVVPEPSLRSCACVTVDDEFPIEPPLERARIVGGPYAVLRHQGPYANMKIAYQWLYGEWLVKSGREAADLPAFEEYINTPVDTAPNDLITDIHLPLR